MLNKPFFTLSTPLELESTKTLGLTDSMNDHILAYVEKFEFLKNASVEPDLRHPYGIFVCLDRSSADSIGLTILSTVRKAAKLAV